MSTVKALILTGFGLNCDTETALAFEMAGAQSRRVHINTLISGEERLVDYHILALGGGFSWGDDHGAGVIQALKLKHTIGKDLLDFVAAGKLVIGICNGFQALVNLGLLPGLDAPVYLPRDWMWWIILSAMARASLWQTRRSLTG